MAPVIDTGFPFDYNWWVVKIDLEAKLEFVASERQALRLRLEHLEGVEEAIRLLITEEQAAAAQQLALFPGSDGNGQHAIGRTPLSRFLFDVLANGAYRSLRVLSQIGQARGLDFEGKNPRRVLHFALIGLQRNGYAEYNRPERGWRLTNKALQAVKSNATPHEQEQGHNLNGK